MCLCDIFAGLFPFFSNLWLILSTSLHFLLRGAEQSSHVERGCDKTGEKWGREEKKRGGGGGGGEGKTEGRERGRLRIRLGVEYDQGRRDKIKAIKDRDVQR